MNLIKSKYWILPAFNSLPFSVQAYMHTYIIDKHICTWCIYKKVAFSIPTFVKAKFKPPFLCLADMETASWMDRWDADVSEHVSWWLHDHVFEKCLVVLFSMFSSFSLPFKMCGLLVCVIWMMTLPFELLI